MDVIPQSERNHKAAGRDRVTSNLSDADAPHSPPQYSPSPTPTASSTRLPSNDQSSLSIESHDCVKHEPDAADPPQDVESQDRVPTPGELYTVFTQKQKNFIVFIASFAGFFSPLAGNIYFPALNDIASDLNVSSELINLTLTSYLIFQGLAPTVMGDLADMAGRRPVYILAFTIFIAANIGLALQNNYVALFILRCLQSSGSSGTIALSYGTVSDIAVTSERGKYLGYASSGFMVGPAIGPVVGGVLSQFLGWKSIFWFLAIFSGVLFTIILFLFPETARNVVGNGSVPPPKWDMSLISYIQLRRHRGSTVLERTCSAKSARMKQASLARTRKLHFPNPLKAIHIILEKDVSLLLFFNSFVYTAFYCVTASLPLLLGDNYGFDTLRIGLCFIPWGVGCAVASIANGRMLDWNYRRIATQLGFAIDKERGEDLRNFPIEKARLQVGLPVLYMGVVTLVIYGWVQDAKVHVAAPIVLLFLLGVFVNGAFNASNTFLVDLYPQSPATATSANNLVRCLMGAGGSAVITPMIRKMGVGWCFTFIAFVLLITSPMLWVLLRWGPGWREERRMRLLERKSLEDAEANEDERGVGSLEK